MRQLRRAHDLIGRAAMRPSMVAGLIVVVIGAFVFVRSLAADKRPEALNLRGTEIASAERPHVPPWVGAMVCVAGLGFAAAGTQRWKVRAA